MRYTILCLSALLFLSSCTGSEWKEVEQHIDVIVGKRLHKKIVVIINPQTGCMGCIQKIIENSLVKIKRKENIIVITNIDIRDMYQNFIYNVYIDEEELIFDLNKKYKKKNCVLFLKNGKVVSDFELNIDNYDTLPKLKI